MTASTRLVDGVTIVDLGGRIVLGEGSAGLRDLVRNLVSEGIKKILLNLRNVDYIDSSGLGGTGMCVHKHAQPGRRTEVAQPH